MSKRQQRWSAKQRTSAEWMRTNEQRERDIQLRPATPSGGPFDLNRTRRQPDMPV
jgi:hypothetical protein